MTSDEQEALSHQHSHGRWCVPLDSGKIAVFDHPAKGLVAIVDNWAGVLALPTRPVYAPVNVSHGVLELDLKGIDI